MKLVFWFFLKDNLMDMDDCACEACDWYNGYLIFRDELVDNEGCATFQQIKVRFRQIEEYIWMQAR